MHWNAHSRSSWEHGSLHFPYDVWNIQTAHICTGHSSACMWWTLMPAAPQCALECVAFMGGGQHSCCAPLLHTLIFQYFFNNNWIGLPISTWLSPQNHLDNIISPLYIYHSLIPWSFINLQYFSQNGNHYLTVRFFLFCFISLPSATLGSQCDWHTPR